MEFKEKLSTYVERAETGIDQLLPGDAARPARLHAAMRYSMKVGGKRIRPALLLAAAELFPAQADPLPAAVAIECLHTYTLIHDDLPSIDNGDLRRGQPTCHKQFDEPTAVLAGDSLLTYAFELLAERYAERPAIGLKLVAALSEAAGSRRLIGGQMEDILGEKLPLDYPQLRWIHLNKTAALIEASLLMGGHCGGASDAHLETLRQYGRRIGLAFQVVDDILDATSDAATLGKNAGSDAAHGKTTYVSLVGLEAARQEADQLAAEARDLARQLPGDPAFLLGLVDHLNTRVK